MELFHQHQLPDGIWVVKWIDRFHRGNDSDSPKVTAWLVPAPDGMPLRDLEQLAPRRLSEVLGKQPGSGVARQALAIACELQAAYLSHVHVGDLISGGATVGRLPRASGRIELTVRSAVLDQLVGDALTPPPDGYRGNYRVLNDFDFRTRDIPEIGSSHCLVIQEGEVEFILPKVVIFRAFYGFHSLVTTAICSHNWYPDAMSLVLPSQPERGLLTGVDEDGTFRILLGKPIPEGLTPLLAHLWLDPDGQREVNHIYSAVRIETGQTGQLWFVDANIPFPMTESSLRIDVQGYALRPFSTGQAAKARERFLVTKISGSRWPYEHRETEHAYVYSNDRGEVHETPEDGETRGSGHGPVTGDPSAIAVSNVDPNAKDRLSLFEGQPFEFKPKPRFRRQDKSWSRSYGRRPGLPPGEVSTIVSAGTRRHLQTEASPVQLQQPLRSPSAGFDFLLLALEELVRDGVIGPFKAVRPSDSTYLTVRNGLPCWTLLNVEDRVRTRVPARGWEVVKESPAASSRHGRSVLVLELAMPNGSDLYLFEIETRPAETFGYLTVVIRASDEVDQEALQRIVDLIRETSGRIRAPLATSGLRGYAVLKHRRAGKVAQGPAAWDTASLGKALLKLSRSNPPSLTARE